MDFDVRFLFFRIQMIAVCVYLFPLLMGRAEPACELILSQLDWMNLAIFYPLLFRYLRLTSSPAPTSMYLLSERIVQSCLAKSHCFTISPYLQDINCRNLALAANSNPDILYLMTVEAISLLSKAEDCSACIYTSQFTVYPMMHTFQQNPFVEQVEFNPIYDNILTVVYDDLRTKHHSVTVYKLNRGCAIAETLLLYRGRDDCDASKCECTSGNYAQSFLAASWSPSGAVLAVYESKDRFSVLCSAHITLFTLLRNDSGTDTMRRIDCSLPTLGRLNLIQRSQSFLMQLWQSESTLLISNSDESEELTCVEISTKSNFTKLIMRPAQRLPIMQPVCDPRGVLQGRSCVYSEINSKSFPVHHMTPYGYWIINGRDLITCEQCVIRDHRSHSSLMTKRLGDTIASPGAIDTVIFPKHRVHDAAARSDMPDRLLVLIGPSGAGDSLFDGKTSVMYAKISNRYKYSCPAPQPWLSKRGKNTFYALVSVHSSTLECEVICQSSIPLASGIDNYNHLTTLTIMGQSSTHLVARECCKVEDYPSCPSARFYTFPKFGGEIREMTNNVYIPSPYSRYSVKLPVQETDLSETHNRWLSIVEPNCTLTNDLSPPRTPCAVHAPSTCSHCKRRKPNVEPEMLYPPLKCMIVKK